MPQLRRQLNDIERFGASVVIADIGPNNLSPSSLDQMKLAEDIVEYLGDQRAAGRESGRDIARHAAIRISASEVTTSLESRLRGGPTRHQPSRDGSGPRDAMSHDIVRCWWPKQYADFFYTMACTCDAPSKARCMHRGSIAMTSCSMSRVLACATTEKLLLVTHNVKLPDF